MNAIYIPIFTEEIISLISIPLNTFSYLITKSVAI